MTVNECLQQIAEAKKALAAAQVALNASESLLKDYKSEVLPEVLPEVPPAVSATVVEPVDEFATLQAMLPDWPMAVDPETLCDAKSPADRQERAGHILDMIFEGVSLEGKVFLDFGCGTGETLDVAMGRGCKKAVGYDFGPFEGVSKGIVTNEFAKVEAHGPYDVVMLYDVIDHLVKETPTEVLNRIRTIMSPNAMVYIRCHPWSGAHGGHLYKHFNKAFAHIIFTPEELAKMGYTLDANIRRVLFPMQTYRDIFNSAHFKIVKEKATQDPLGNDAFFRKPFLKERIVKAFGRGTYPNWQLSLSFVDFILS